MRKPLLLAAPGAPGSTRHVALARLPRRLPKRSPHVPAVSDYREFQDGEVVPGTRYRVTRLIGTGGMGRVYEVEHLELGKRFVLKALLRELSRRDDLVARLRNEWRALARLEHPNIVNVTDAGTSENGVPFYVMERLEGETLSALLHRQRRLLPQDSLRISSAILEGLHAAHQIGVVHRDVKPPNIFLTAGQAVKVLDFGIAKIKDAKGVITARGIAVGTPRYMSPEQAQGGGVDARSDIYACGLMLFEMLSGVGPFDDARDNNELLLAHLGRKAPPLSSICVVAPELDAIVAAMLAKDPRERPGSAREVAETLTQLASRYAHFVATDAPTLNTTPRPGAFSESAMRSDIRRGPQPMPATRPDGPAALGRPTGDTTTLQPALEIATTAAHALPQGVGVAGGTQRLPSALPPAPPSFYGPDTLVDPLTRAPTAVPPSAPERTEFLINAPPSPHRVERAVADAGPTRTAVPVAEGTNFTPPPVVPSVSSPPPRSTRPKLVLGLVAAALAGVSFGAAALLWRSRTPAPVPAAIAAAPPSPALAPVPPKPSTNASGPLRPESSPAAALAMPPVPAASIPVAAPPASLLNKRQKASVAAVNAPAKAAPAPTPAGAQKARVSSMPGSGL